MNKKELQRLASNLNTSVEILSAIQSVLKKKSFDNDCMKEWDNPRSKKLIVQLATYKAPGKRLKWAGERVSDG